VAELKPQDALASMSAISKLRQKQRRVFAFGDYERDTFVAKFAEAHPSGIRVLDVGAGPCRYRSTFAHCDYRTQDLCDHAPSNVGGLMNEIGYWEYGKIDYVCDASAIPVPDAFFDAVLCTEVLEHVLDPADVVTELGRILKPGGKLLLTAPLGSGLHQEPDHYYGGFTPYWYRMILPHAKFDTIEIAPNGGFFKHYGQESRRFSALLDPRRLSPLQAVAALPLFILSVPILRVAMPVLCYYLDKLDAHRGFTVGYHVLAVRGQGVNAARQPPHVKGLESA